MRGIAPRARSLNTISLFGGIPLAQSAIGAHRRSPSCGVPPRGHARARYDRQPAFLEVRLHRDVVELHQSAISESQDGSGLDRCYAIVVLRLREGDVVADHTHNRNVAGASEAALVGPTNAASNANV